MSIDVNKPYITYAYVVDDNETIITKEFNSFDSLIKFINLEFIKLENVTFFKCVFDSHFRSSLKLSDNLGFWQT